MASRRSLLRAAGAATVLGAGGTFAYGQAFADAGPGEPTALVAGSLLSVASAVGGASIEAHGSAAVRRLILDDLRRPDAVALADPRLFAGISDRATLFATNALVLAVAPDSPHAGALRDDWRAAIADPSVALGRTDPERDPLGYRTVMALRLAERRSGVDADDVLARARVFPETDLLNVLEGGAVDAAFAYRNMAAERGLPHVPLPAAIDFSDPAHAETYASVSYELDGTPITGAPIRYGARALTDRGTPWVEALVGETDRLRAHGFAVPAGYPVRDQPLGELSP